MASNNVCSFDRVTREGGLPSSSGLATPCKLVITTKHLQQQHQVGKQLNVNNIHEKEINNKQCFPSSSAVPPTQASRQDCLIDFQFQLRLQLHVLLVQLTVVAHQAAGGHALELLSGQFLLFSCTALRVRTMNISYIHKF